MTRTGAVAILALCGALAACETTGSPDDGVDFGVDADVEGSDTGIATATDGGSVESSDPNAVINNDRIVTLQVDDYQEFLDDTIREYILCMRSTTVSLDDGTGSVDDFAALAQRRCESTYRTAHRTASLLESQDKIVGLRGQALQLAIETALANRS